MYCISASSHQPWSRRKREGGGAKTNNTFPVPLLRILISSPHGSRPLLLPYTSPIFPHFAVFPIFGGGEERRGRNKRKEGRSSVQTNLELRCAFGGLVVPPNAPLVIQHIKFKNSKKKPHEKEIPLFAQNLFVSLSIRSFLGFLHESSCCKSVHSRQTKTLSFCHKHSSYPACSSSPP